MRNNRAENRQRFWLLSIGAITTPALTGLLLHLDFALHWSEGISEVSSNFSARVFYFLSRLGERGPLGIALSAVVGFELACGLVLLWMKFSLDTNTTVRIAGSTRLIADRPITSHSEDRFDFSPAIEKLVPLLIRAPGSPSLVVAIEGRWGTGKTSALRLLQKKLNAEPGLILVEFSPWMIESKDSLVQSFLMQLGVELRTHLTVRGDIQLADQLTDAFSRMCKLVPLLIGAPNAKEWSEAISIALPEKKRDAIESFSTAKAEVQEAIRKVALPIIVCMDDIDRLSDDEIKVIAQVVRAVCDFDGITYALCFDLDQVATAIGRGGDIHKGREYLEKIVQATIRLPSPSLRARSAHLKSLVQSALGTVLTTKEQDDLGPSCTLLALLVDSPRGMIRLINQVVINLGNSHIYLPDVLLFEALHVEHPDITQRIKLNPERFAAQSMEGDSRVISWMMTYMKEDQREKAREEFFEGVVRNVSTEEKSTVNRILDFLFPSARGVTGQRLHPSINDRIDYLPNLERLLQLSDLEQHFSAADALDVLGSKENRESILIRHLEASKSADFFNYLRPFVAERGISEPSHFIRTVMTTSATAFRKDKIETSTAAAAIILTVLRKGDVTIGMKPGLLNEVVISDQSLSISHRVLLDVLYRVNAWREGARLPQEAYKKDELENFGVSPETLDSFAIAWTQTVEDRVAAENILLTEEDPIAVLFRWGQLGNPQDVKLATTKYLKEPESVRALLHGFRASGVNGFENYVENWSAFIERISEFEKEFPVEVEKFKEHTQVLNTQRE